MSPAPAPEVVTLGCRLNIAESETIRALAAGRDMIVVNSCAVTNAAVKQTRAAIRRARRARPGAELVVTGCAAEIDPAGFEAMTEVDRVVGNLDKLAPRHWGNGFRLPHRHSRAFVAVQNGCDHACTFCAIPAGRGASRSTPISDVVAQIGLLVEAGHREVVLTGVDLTSYGHDLPDAPKLGRLVEAILRETKISRVRLSSLDSIEIDDALFDLLASEPRMMPHVHLSFQAGDDMVLKRMKRRHLREHAIGIVARLKARRDIAIGADLIAGFPTEDATMFANTLALIDECDIVHAHVFPYSAREGTPAARMPQVSGEVRRARAEALRKAAARRKRAWVAGMVGTVQDVLIEKPGDRGHTPGFAEVFLVPPPLVSSEVEKRRAPPATRFSTSLEANGSKGVSTSIGAVSRVDITGATDTHLIGTFA